MKLKIILISFLISLPFWWGMNVLEENLNFVFFWREISKNPYLLTAQIAKTDKSDSWGPVRNREIGDIEIAAKSAISVFVPSDSSFPEKILFEKDGGKALPIASVTKLMTAYVVLENYDPLKEIAISENSANQEGNFGNLKAGKIFPVKYLLYPLLIESNNAAALALAGDYEGMNKEKFVEIMNLNAEGLGLNGTRFVNPTGLDENNPENGLNVSTGRDLAKFGKVLLKKPLIWEILSTPKEELYGPVLTNTNKLLEEIPRLLGGKTGYTEKAGGCLFLVQAAPKNKGYIINVILGAANHNERFQEMEKMVDWVNRAYIW